MTASLTPAPARGRAREAAPAALLTAALVLLGIGGLLTAGSRPAAPLVVTGTLAVGFLPMGLFVVTARPGHLVGRIILGTGLLALSALAVAAWSTQRPAAWATQWMWWPPIVLVPLALLAFPEGALPTRGRRRLALVLTGSAALTTLALAAAASSAPTTLLTSGQTAPEAAHPWLLAAGLGALACLGLTLVVVVDMVRRARTDAVDGRVRSQILCLLPAGVLLVIGVVLDAVGVPYALVPAALALPVGMGWAILRHGVDDLDLAVNRTLVWIVMSGMVLVTFAVMTGLTSTAVLQDRPLLASAIGTGIIAAGFDPVRRLVQRFVDRMLFGDRDRPHIVVQRLGERMHAASDPGSMLTELVTTLGTALRVPHVRMLVLTDGPEPVVAAEWGRPQTGATRIPMLAHGEPVGTLEVAPRRPGERFTQAEDALLRQVAGQAAIAAQAHRLTLELHHARVVLVRAREEERLRLRRDLHDGLGPALAGTRMQLSAARGRLVHPMGRDDIDAGAGPAVEIDAQVAVLIEAALEVLTDCTSEVRRVVDGLRPAALDRGLGAALRQRAETLLGDAARIDLDDDLSDLPPAVEVAAYRIATEAMTNVVKHAAARTCHLQVRRDHEVLHVLVADDGTGLTTTGRGGVGLGSMRTRAEELGGSCVVVDAHPGTRVEARLPMRGH